MSIVILPFDVLQMGDEELTAFKDAINITMQTFKEGDSEPLYGMELKRFKTSLSLPDLSSPDVLDIISKWEEK